MNQLNKMYSGKAGNLQILKNKGFLVPDFIVVPDSIKNEDEFEKTVAQHNLNSDFFAVRSSANIEDSKIKSFAGHFYSAIGVKRNNLYKEYLNVVESFQNEQGSIIIQKFINSTKSGVLFTNDGNNQIAINANFGLCKSVVEGGPCDEFIVDRKGNIVSQNIEINKEPLYFKNEVLEKSQPNSDTSLTHEEIKTLVKTALKIENLFGNPQDIEWCFLNNILYILQSRPITQNISNSKDSIHYDSANIAESYSGIISPLTISFATRIYKTVYINLLRASGASSQKIKKNISIFNSLVQDFYGRIYYNMNNWYLMMSFIPGYSKNKENLEDMITSNIRESVTRTVKPSVWLKLGYPFIVIFKLIFFSLAVNRFKRNAHKYLKQFRSFNIHSFDYNQCLKQYQKLNDHLLEKWHITVENDFIMMSYLGILKKKMKDEELQKMLNFDNKSAQQVLELKKLSDIVYSIPELKDICIQTDSEKFEEFLIKTTEIKSKFDHYFTVYGGRFANELKLESSDLEEDKKALLQILNLYNNFNPVPHQHNLSKPKKSILKYVLNRVKHFAAQREELRLLRSNCFSIVRKLFLQIGRIYYEQGLINNIDDIFFLTESEIFTKSEKDFKTTIDNRKSDYKKYKTIQPLPFFSISKDETPPLKEKSTKAVSIIKGRACSSGVIKGKIRVFKEYYLPENIDFDILVSKNTDPGWVTLIALSKGLIIEHGGILSHAAIVSRELGIPTIIGVENATEIFNDLQTVELNGNTGLIKVIE